jgi:hypothetical protein
VIEVEAEVARKEAEEFLPGGVPGARNRDEGEAGVAEAEGQLASEFEAEGA